jgi:hypothetical protein
MNPLDVVNAYSYEARRGALDLGRENWTRWGRFASIVRVSGCGSTVTTQPVTFPSMFTEPPIMTYGVRLISGGVGNGMPLITATVVEWVMDPRALNDPFRQHCLGARMGYCTDMPYVSDLGARAALVVDILLSFEGVAVKGAQGVTL